MPRRRFSRNSGNCFSAAKPASVGKRNVASDTPNTPCGSSISRTAYSNDATICAPLERSIQKASVCVIMMLNWNAATPIVAGIILRTTSRTESLRHGATQRSR